METGRKGWSLGDGFQLSGLGAIALIQFNRYHRAPTVCHAHARRSLPHSCLWPLLEDAGVPLFPGRRSAAVTCLGKSLSSLIKHHFFFFFNRKGAVERHLSPHTTQALGKDMRTLGSFHRTLGEMARYRDPKGQACLPAASATACVMQQPSGCPMGMYLFSRPS